LVRADVTRLVHDAVRACCVCVCVRVCVCACACDNHTTTPDIPRQRRWFSI
jgi:hypothetical protein